MNASTGMEKLKTKGLATLSLAVSVALLQANSSLLPELEKHRRFAIQALNSGNAGAANAASDVLGMKKITYRFAKNAPATGRQALIEAIGQWERLLKRDIQFVEAFSFQEPDVMITFEAQLGSNGKHFGGFTTWQRQILRHDNGDYEAKLAATLQLRTVTPKGKPMDLAQMRHAAMHELGHILGLDDSDEQGDVMGPLDLARPVITPKTDEVAQILKLRKEAQDIRNRAASFGKV
ncbi:MAG: matrixin family metalloprotease [Fimbriimonadaceae bacterium]